MLTNERIDAIFAELASYVIELEPDPTALGPQYFRDRIAICRNFLNRVSAVTLELEREKLTLSAELRRLEAGYSLNHDDLLANDVKVKSLGSIEDRKATVGYLLRDQKQAINTVKDHLHAVESTVKVTAHRTKELNSTMTAIKDQKSAMQAEIKSGSFYGDERPNEDVNSNLEDEMARLMAEEPATAQEAIEPETIDLKEEVVISSSEDDQIQQFLLSDGEAPQKDEDDFAAFLDV